MAIVTIRQAKTQLSKLIARAEAGEEIVIARGTKPAVRLQPLRPLIRRAGIMNGIWPDLPNSF